MNLACESSQKHNIYIYIWSKALGNLVKMLEGPKEGLADMTWHPTRPMFATISHFGTIYLWGVHYVQNFSAFAPSFTELEDNVEYKEREDEFDIISDNENDNIAGKEDDELEVDVTTFDFKAVSDTEDEGLDFDDHLNTNPFFIPIEF